VARNLAIDLNRRHPDDMRTSLPLSSPDGNGGRVWQPHEAAISPSLRPRQRAHLDEVLTVLTLREQQILLAAEEDGYTAAEIAVRLGISPDSVYKTIWRARQKIKRAFPEPRSTDEVRVG
jgi:RNA polymerase sigma factor (sigma-70 family)